ncbi:outer membrane protein assembly factor BamB family protein [Salinibius halmophilus]|uniref:outer membrane protein assembly factor BamB family protein n=1 Tax=Salinibius halmophilus TaxID=1853216 RepID=UPI000E66028E|nr:PQQ-binding-like beta-propeller repeat protein [Salinibius halmophilus]
MKYALSALITLSLVGCASTGPQAPSITPVAGSPEPVTRWAIDIVDRQGGIDYQDSARVRQLVPDVDQSLAFAAFGNQVVSGQIDAGAEVWRTQLDETVAAGPVEQDGRVFVTTDNADLIALDSNTGEVLWSVELPARSDALVAVQGDRVVVQMQDGTVQARAVSNGRTFWSYRSASQPDLSLIGTANPVLANNLVIVANANGSVLALSLASGEVAWEYRLSYPKGATPVAQLVDADATPLISGNTVLATANDGVIYQIDLASGRVLGDLEASSLEQLLLAGDRLVVAEESGSVVALNSAGEALWRNDAMLDRAPFAPVFWNNAIWVADTFGALIAIDPETGETLSAKQMDISGLAESPVVTDEWMLLMSADGRLAGIKVR